MIADAVAKDSLSSMVDRHGPNTFRFTFGILLFIQTVSFIPKVNVKNASTQVNLRYVC